MKYILPVLVVLLCSGCLMLGAPHYYHYKLPNHKADSIMVISYPSQLDYQYRFAKNEWDSVFVFDPIHQLFQKMELKENANFYPKVYYSFYKKEHGNVKKMDKVKSVVLKRYQQNSVYVDTLYYHDVK